MAGWNNNRRTVGLCLALAVVTLLVYLPATGNEFVTLDDHEYIVDNPHVTEGLTWPGMLWALRITGYASNWHPLTWMSHMADCQIYGLHAGGHHLTSVLLHVANSVLVLLLLNQMTGRLWRSAAVAALFAWHPLHVESVAWASERKDVLSTLFWLLTMMAYVKYVNESIRLRSKASARQEVQSPRSKVYYGLALVCFALGLMSKPMLVTLPCVLLLLDFWPLGRICDLRFAIYASKEGGNRTSVARLIWEKAPFFLLALGASLVTYRVQQAAGAMSTFAETPLSARLGNATLAYFQYLSKTIWPADLAAFYPYSKHQSAVVVAVCGGLLAGLSALFVLVARRRPYLVTGWFWYLGTLVPTIGLVQVGSQSMADRYMYIPSIGLFVAMVWGLSEFLTGLPRRWEVLATTSALALAGCLAVTWVQIKYWHDSERLFRHAIEVTVDNDVAYNGLGGALDEAGEPAKAMACYVTAVELDPRYPEAQYNLGTSLLRQNRLDEAITHLNAALAGNPKYVPAHINLGKAFMQQGRLGEAGTQLALAVDLNPEYTQAHYNLGTLLLAEGKLDGAIAQFMEALRLKPGDAETLGNLGITLMSRGRATEGIARLEEAARLTPKKPGAHSNLGLALLEQNRTDEAAAEFGAAARLNPNDAAAQYNLARTLGRQHKVKEAAGRYREAVRLKPDFAEAMSNLAWMLSTDPDPQLRNGGEAAQLAEKACELTHYQQAGLVLTLAAARAETGQFGEAAARAQQALELATAAGQQEAAARSGKLLKLFQAGQPFRGTN